MTTAARPTWNAAVGGHTLRDTGAAPTLSVSARDLATQTKLKLRQPGQNAPWEIDEEVLRARLEEKEREHFEKIRGSKRIGGGEIDVAALKRVRLVQDSMDIDGSDDDEAADDDSESESDSDDDEDDEAELLRELEKIRKERAEEKERADRERLEEDERQREEEALTGNPLLEGNKGRDFSVKRRWDDDVVFKNQAKGIEDNPKQRFINDLLRSDFHRKFMGKYIK
ncbi:Pre-mRNA-splicing factor Cwf15/Cwc15 [Phlyctochytrium arcticum]|nr:Pre-mRNA-splicing factor Cwf15/Cwc15 [Phlyctochytrium arcticum]